VILSVTKLCDYIENIISFVNFVLRFLYQWHVSFTDDLQLGIVNED